jgi:hypothetical protein
MTESYATIISSTFIAAVSIIGILVSSHLTSQNQRKDWDRQRQWELKRDVVFEVLRDLRQFLCKLHDLRNAYNGIPVQCLEDAAHPEKQKDIAWERFCFSNAKIRTSIFIAKVLVGEALNTALSKYYDAIFDAGAGVREGEARRYDDLFITLEQLDKTLHEAARKELNINNPGQVVAEN